MYAPEAFGDGIFACNPRDFGIFMPKHLAGQWLLNSYEIFYNFLSTLQTFRS